MVRHFLEDQVEALESILVVDVVVAVVEAVDEDRTVVFGRGKFGFGEIGSNGYLSRLSRERIDDEIVEGKSEHFFKKEYLRFFLSEHLAL